MMLGVRLDVPARSRNTGAADAYDAGHAVGHARMERHAVVNAHWQLQH